MRLCSALLALSSLSAQTPTSAAPEKERFLGARLAGDLRARVSVVANPRVDDYLSRLGAQLTAQMPARGLTCTFTVMADDTAGGIHEPIALPGCLIFVPAPLLLDVYSEAEFAGMLAHAIAHRAVPHRSVEIQYPTLEPEGGLIPAGLAKTQRDRELQADVIAVQAMAKAGFNPEAFLQYIGRVQPVSVGRPDASALPDRTARLVALRQVIQTLPTRPYSAGAEFPAVQEELRRAMAK